MALSVTFQSILVNHPPIPKSSKLSQALSTHDPRAQQSGGSSTGSQHSKAAVKLRQPEECTGAKGWEDEEDASQHWPLSHVQGFCPQDLPHSL